MNKPETVSAFQMAVLFLSFMTGSAIVNIPAPLTIAAKNGAWVSLIISSSCGLLLLGCVLYLRRQYPALTFIDYSRKAVGNVLTAILAVPFLAILFQMLANIIFDIGGFLSSTMMRETPPYVFHSLILLTAGMTARAGIEVMARMFLILLFTMFFFATAVVLLVSPNYHAEYLLPVMPDGFNPILHGAYISWGFPYAELLLFAMLLSFVSEKQQSSLNKYMFAAFFINVISLIAVVISTIAATGPISSQLKYSMYQIARLISVQDIIERIESVIGIALIAGSYMKATIVLFVITLTLTRLFKLQSQHTITFPAAFLTLMLSLTMYNNELEHVENSIVIWPVFITSVGVLPLVVIAVVTFFKKRKEKQN